MTSFKANYVLAMLRNYILIIRIMLVFLLLYLKPYRMDAQRLQPGVSVSPYVITIQQPDGSDLRIIGKVDEQIAYTETEDGYTILKNDLGYYEYAERHSNGAIKLSGIKAKNKDRRRSKERKFLQMITKHLRYESPYLDTLKKEKTP